MWNLPHHHLDLLESLLECINQIKPNSNSNQNKWGKFSGNRIKRKRAILAQNHLSQPTQPYPHASGPRGKRSAQPNSRLTYAQSLPGGPPPQCHCHAGPIGSFSLSLLFFLRPSGPHPWVLTEWAEVGPMSSPGLFHLFNYLKPKLTLNKS